MRQTWLNHCEVLLKCFGSGLDGMFRGERIRNLVLHEVVADRHLAAEAIAAIGDGHFAGVVRRGLHQDGYAEAGEPQRIGHGAFVAKVGQGDDDAVNLGGMGAKQVSALLGLGVGLDGAVIGLFRAQDDGTNSCALQSRQHNFAAGAGKMARKKSAIAHDDAESLHRDCLSALSAQGAGGTRLSRRRL